MNINWYIPSPTIDVRQMVSGTSRVRYSLSQLTCVLCSLDVKMCLAIDAHSASLSTASLIDFNTVGWWGVCMGWRHKMWIKTHILRRDTKSIGL